LGCRRTYGGPGRHTRESGLPEEFSSSKVIVWNTKVFGTLEQLGVPAAIFNFWTESREGAADCA